eukprot:scaffold40627_cov67-Phaeocystis_antarctica.AAC.7
MPSRLMSMPAQTSEITHMHWCLKSCRRFASAPSPSCRCAQSAATAASRAPASAARCLRPSAALPTAVACGWACDAATNASTAPASTARCLRLPQAHGPASTGVCVHGVVLPVQSQIYASTTAPDCCTATSCGYVLSAATTASSAPASTARCRRLSVA